MPKSPEQFKSEHKAFRARLRKIHKSEIGIAARNAMNGLRAAYKAAALDHWKELGNRASTGWGSVPEGDYQSDYDPEQCADSIANVLAEYFSNDPNNPPGKMSEI